MPIETPAATATDVILRVDEVTKHYGKVHAVDGISFSVLRASVFTLFGPNGASKTTTMEILEGIRDPGATGGTLLLVVDKASFAWCAHQMVSSAIDNPGNLRFRNNLCLSQRRRARREQRNIEERGWPLRLI